MCLGALHLFLHPHSRLKPRLDAQDSLWRAGRVPPSSWGSVSLVHFLQMQNSGCSFIPNLISWGGEIHLWSPRQRCGPEVKKEPFFSITDYMGAVRGLSVGPMRHVYTLSPQMGNTGVLERESPGLGPLLHSGSMVKLSPSDAERGTPAGTCTVCETSGCGAGMWHATVLRERIPVLSVFSFAEPGTPALEPECLALNPDPPLRAVRLFLCFVSPAK